MDKKNYLIIGATIAVFAVTIIAILLLGKNKGDWTKDILEATSYQITMIDCNGREKQLENNVLNSLSNKWTNLSDNGPWMGDTNNCYTTITVSYDNNGTGVINKKEILIIDDSSLALIVGNNSIYYTNAEEIINYLNTLFIA